MTLSPVRERSTGPQAAGSLGALASVRARYDALVDRIPPRLRMPVGIAVLVFVGYLLWWAAFYPGLMTYDSFNYTWESTTGHWIDDHSIFYISCVWLSLKITGDYALLTFGQIVGAALSIGYLAAGLRKFRIRTGWIVASVVLLVALPSSGDFVVYIWKDVPYVIGGVLAFAAITHIVGDALRVPRALRKDKAHRTTPVWGQRRDWLLMGAGFTLSCLSRNNGFLAVFLSGAVFVLCMPWLWRRIAIATLIPIMIFVVLDKGVYPALGVTQPTDYAGNTFIYADIAYAYSKSPQSFNAADKALLSELAPLSHWKKAGADCYGTDALTSGLNKTAAAAHNSQLMSLFVKSLQKAPDDFIDATICRGTPAWAINPAQDRTFIMGIQSSPNGYTFMYAHPELYQSPYYGSMHVRPLSTSLHKALNWWYNLGKTPELNWILWNGATWCWIAYLILARLTRKVWRREVLAIGAVCAGMQLNVFIATPGPLFRYMATPFFIGVLALPLAFSRLKREDAPQEQQTLPAAESQADSRAALNA
ncbi:hypothetical protein [Streptacidiphilus sp. MAP5-3]|uniref:hypothetical protein n=1 Tax=unclassified Streptacidiphilus TaxID=2643834 RepID=UPI0035160D39